jgi:hypothetical protein
MIENPALQDGDRAVAVELGFEMRAELRLATRPLEKENE